MFSLVSFLSFKKFFKFKFKFCWFIDRFVLCWACSCHPWSRLSHELLVGKALRYRRAAYVFSSRAYFIFNRVGGCVCVRTRVRTLFLVLNCWIFWTLHLPWMLGHPRGCFLLILTDPAPESIPSGWWKHWPRAKPSGDSCGRIPGSFCVLYIWLVGNCHCESRFLLTMYF